MNQPGSIESMKRSDTAELRRRFDDITKFLADGYNHKQICEHLNSEGLAIPYSNYRAIMTRLRRERIAADSNVSQVPVSATASVLEVRARPDLAVHAPTDADEQNVAEKKFSWNPGSEVKWK